MNPGYFDVHFKMGKLFERNSDFESATKMYLRAVEIKKEDPWAHFRLGWIYIRSGDRARGIDHLKKSI